MSYIFPYSVFSHLTYMQYRFFSYVPSTYTQSLKQKYDDFQVSIDIEDSLVTVKSPNTLLSRTPDTISWNGNLWKSATGRVRKILQQVM